MKRLCSLGLAVLIILALAGCSLRNHEQAVIDSPGVTADGTVTPDLDGLVGAAIKAREISYASGEVATEGHLILETKENGSVLTVYTIASFGAFGSENGIFTKISGTGAIPTVMVFIKDESGAYVLSEYQEPLDGSAYLASVKKMFPRHLHQRVLSSGDDYSVLVKQEEEQAAAYLADIGRKAPVSAAAVEKQLPQIDVTASNKLFTEFTKDDPFLNNCPYWLGTRERVEDGTRYIYATAQEKTLDGKDLIIFQKKTEDGRIIAEQRYEIVGTEPQQVDNAGTKMSNDTITVDEEILALRGTYFDFCIANRLDYVPLFEEGEAPTESSAYLLYAFVINLANWGEDKGIMTRTYVEEVIKTHFLVEEVKHVSLYKCWDFDGEKYLPIPGGVNGDPIYVLQEYATYQQDGHTVYDLVLDECTFGNKIPNEDEMAMIRTQIMADDVSNLVVIRTERYKYYLDGKGQVVFLAHTQWG